MSSHDAGLFIAIYTDEDITSDLVPALRQRGYKAISTVEAENRGLSDEEQLAYAAQRELVILTCNARDFLPLAQTWFWADREHAGIIISHQFSRRQFGELLRQVLRLLDSLTAEELRNQVVFLQQFGKHRHQ